MKRRPGIEVSRDGLWAMLTDSRGILFRAAAEWDDDRSAAVFRFRDEQGRRLLGVDPTIAEARAEMRRLRSRDSLVDEDYQPIVQGWPQVDTKERP